LSVDRRNIRERIAICSIAVHRGEVRVRTKAQAFSGG
jgi:hypothetical protein